MVDQLAAKCSAPREAIATDVVAMLQDLADGVSHRSAGRRQVDSRRRQNNSRTK
jgi:hypothetical protein